MLDWLLKLHNDVLLILLIKFVWKYVIIKTNIRLNNESA